MSALQTLGFMVATVSLAFLAGFGLMLGAWAGMQFGSKWFGPMNIRYNAGSTVPAHESSAAQSEAE